MQAKLMNIAHELTFTAAAVPAHGSTDSAKTGYYPNKAKIRFLNTARLCVLHDILYSSSLWSTVATKSETEPRRKFDNIS